MYHEQKRKVVVSVTVKGLEAIDQNFKVETSIQKEDICFYDAEECVFRIYGVFKENGMFRRMPERVS